MLDSAAGTVSLRGLQGPLRRACLCAFAPERLWVEPGQWKEAFATVASSWPVLCGVPFEACAHDYRQRKSCFRSPDFSPRLRAFVSPSKRFCPVTVKENFPEHAQAERVSKVRPRAFNSPAPSVPTLDRMGMRREPLAGDGKRVLRKICLPPFRISQLLAAPGARRGKIPNLSETEFALASAVAPNERGIAAFTDADFCFRVDLLIPILAVDRNEKRRNTCLPFARSLFRSPRLDRWQGGKDARGFSLAVREGAREGRALFARPD
jgi:hypothetical protein